jgi:hypothetical protein
MTMALRDDQFILLCACVAMSTQLDRQRFATDLRLAAEVFNRQVPELAGNLGAVDSMAKLVEVMAAGFAGELPDQVKAALRLLN